MGFLTDLKTRTAAPRAKEYLIADGDGLYLRVRAASKSWIYRYKSDKKQLKIGLGAYPAVMVQQRADFLDELEAGKMPKIAENVLWLKRASTEHALKL